MDSELLYLKKRANFHRRMADQAKCGEGRCAHNAFVLAYLGRIEMRMREIRRGHSKHNGASPSPPLSVAAAGTAQRKLVR